MQSYLEQGIFQKYEKSYVYVERTLKNGSIRRGLIGMIDLEAYDYSDLNKEHLGALSYTIVLDILPGRNMFFEAHPIMLLHLSL